jgi:serine/threonine-protein kinase
MFLNEARQTAQLDHPNIVQIFDLGEVNGQYFIAMEFIDGPSLRVLQRRAEEAQRRLPVPEVMKVVADAAAGLSYAHNLNDGHGRPLGLVHRDISPDNILVHKNGAVKVVDFGIAKAATTTSMTRTGTLKGKIAYMPPEQVRGEPIDRRADIFALGVCLYELISGVRPFDGPSEVAILTAVLNSEPRPLRELRPDAPGALQRILDRALAKDRDRRYGDAAEMHGEIEALLIQIGQLPAPARIGAMVREFAPPEAATPSTTGDGQPLDEAEVSSSAEAAPAAEPGPERHTGRIPPSLTAHGAPAPSPAPRWGAVLVSIATSLAVAGAGGVALGMRASGGSSPGDPSLQVDVLRIAAPGEGTARAASAGAKAALPATGAATGQPAGPPPVAPASVPAPAPPTIATAAGVASTSTRLLAAMDPGPPARPAAAPPPRAAPALPAPAPTPAAAARAATGRLVVDADPPSQVLLDGKSVGTTPLELEAPAGHHQVVVRNGPNKLEKTLELDLPAGGSRSERVAWTKGKIEFRIRPWALVELDGKTLGQTPIPAQEVYEGTYRVRLTNPELGKDVTREVTLAPGQDKVVVKEILDE